MIGKNGTSASQSLLHFQSDHAWFGDTMPLYAQGVYHIYYTARREGGTDAWGHVSTKDFVEFTEHPWAITSGEDGSMDDASLCTGCVYYENGTYYLFYTGRTKRRTAHMLRAVSKDGIHFEKEYRELFVNNEEWYSSDGTWRDPAVFWNEEAKQYWMVFCTRRPGDAPDPFPGSLGLAVSEDLEHWELRPPVPLEHVGGTVECPEVFKLGDKWALIYYWHDTRLRLGDSPSGPWERVGSLSQNHFDFMAAKRMWDGKRHILLGWVPRKECDCAERIWGGCMAVPRELYLDEDGKPACRFIDEMDRHFAVPSEALALDRAQKPYGQMEQGRLHGLLHWPDAPDAYRLRFQIKPQTPKAVSTLFVRTNSAPSDFGHGISNGYQLIFDFPSRALRLREQYVWDQRPDIAFMPLRGEMDREFHVDLILNRDILEIVIDEKESLVYRLAKYTEGGGLALLSVDGSVEIGNWEASALRP